MIIFKKVLKEKEIVCKYYKNKIHCKNGHRYGDHLKDERLSREPKNMPPVFPVSHILVSVFLLTQAE